MKEPAALRAGGFARQSGRRWFAERLPVLAPVGVAVYLAVSHFVFHVSLLIALGAILAGAVGLAVVLRPIWAYYLFVSILTLELIVRVDEVLTLAKFVGALLFFAWVVEVLFRRSYRLPRAPVIVMGPLFLISAMISLSVARDTAAGLERLATILQLVLFLLITATMIRTSRELRRTGAVLLASTTVASLYGIAQVLRGAQTEFEGFGIDRNIMGIMVATCIPILVSLYRQGEAPVRILLVAVGGIFALAEGLSFSRVGFLCMATAIVLSLLFATQWGRVRTGVVFVGVFFAMATLLPADYWNRVSGIEKAVISGSDTVGIRYQLWQASIRMIADHPFFGVGPGNYIGEFMQYGGAIGLRRGTLTSHNSYLSVTAETGFVGGTVFALLLLSGLWGFWSASRIAGASGDPDLRGLVLALGISLLVYCMAIFSVSAEYVKWLWLLLGFSAASLSAARSVREALPHEDALPVAARSR